MNRKSWKKPGILPFLLVLGLLGASGCYSPMESQPVQPVSEAAAPSGPAAVSAAMEPIQSLPEADMVQFFHFLLEMDGKSKTTLTKSQAEAVLPLVRQNVEKGTMDEEDKKAILHIFGDEQMAFYAAWLNRGDEPKAGIQPDIRKDGSLTDEEWQRWKQDWMHRTNQTHPEHPGAEASGPPDVRISPEADGTGSGGWAAGEKNVEQLLMERLEQKIQF